MTQTPDDSEFNLSTSRPATGLVTLAQQLESIGDRVVEIHERRWRGLVGARYDEMLQSSETTERFLSDENPRLRAVAFSVAKDHWRSPRRWTKRYKCAAISDSNRLVRRFAMGCLTALFRGTCDSSVSAILSRAVIERDATARFRIQAYIRLAEIQNVEIPSGLRSELSACATANSSLPSTVDWNMIQRCAAYEMTGR